MIFPVDDIIPDLKAALSSRPSAILVAEPGAGKTTRVPLALLNEPWLAGKKINVEEKIVVDILQQQDSIQIDELYFKSGLSSSAVATALLMLEMQNVVVSLPGKVYTLS